MLRWSGKAGFRPCRRLVRFASATSTTVSSYKNVSEHIQQAIARENPLSEAAALSALRECHKLGDTHKDQKEEQALVKTILDHSHVTSKLLHDFFVSSPPPSQNATILVLDAFNHTHPHAVLPESVAMIPFRYAAYGAHFDDALKILDHTAGTQSNMAAVGNRAIRRDVLYWSSGVVATLAGLDWLLGSGLVGVWESKTMVLSMAFTYISAVSVYGLLAFSNARSGAGEVLAWIKGTSILNRYKYAPKLKMASVLAIMNRNLPENQNECASGLRKELQVRDMMPVESKEEQMLKEYWARGGDGFDWVEPDQDPADIIWRAKMEHTRQRRIGSPYIRALGEDSRWAEGLVTDPKSADPSSPQQMAPSRPQHTIPHASLIDLDKLRSPEQMQKLYETLKDAEDLKKLKGDDNDTPKLG